MISASLAMRLFTTLFVLRHATSFATARRSFGGLPSSLHSTSNNNGFNGMRGGDQIPKKSDLYSDNELQDLLNLHESISGTVAKKNGGIDANDIPSLHESVLQALGEMKSDDNNDEQVEPPTNLFKTNLSADELKSRVGKIRAIASDVDGTLLSADHKLPEYTKIQVIKAVQAAYSPIDPLQHFFIATGKSRKGALDSLGPELEALLSQTPGVFIQGLYCVDADGKVVYENKITAEQVREVEELAKELDVCMICYDGDTLYASNNSDEALLDTVNEKWGEPRPIFVDSQDRLLTDHKPGFHKCLLMHDDPDFITNTVRPRLQEIASGSDATVTQAVDTMMEFLPKGCSKAKGVQELCKHLNIDPATQLMAIGDAENDASMLEMVLLGIAVGNAKPPAKEVADVILEANNCDGAAGVAIAEFGLARKE